MSELDNNDRIRLEQIMARRVEGIILGFIITGLIRASLQGYIPTTATFNYIKSLF